MIYGIVLPTLYSIFSDNFHDSMMDSIQEAGADRGFLPSEDEGTLPGLQQGTELTRVVPDECDSGCAVLPVIP